MSDTNTTGREQKIIKQWYKCPEDHYVLVEGEDVDPHNDVIIDLNCHEHQFWMQPVPEPDECEGCGEFRPIIQGGYCTDCMEEALL